MGLLGRAERIVQQDRDDRPRDMAAIIRNATDRGDPVDEVAQADQYGKRPTRYEHEDIVLSNEYIAMIEHIDRTIKDLIGEVTKLTEYANNLKEAIHLRVIDLTVLVQREKAVVVDLQGHFQDLHARITEKRNEKIAPAPRPNGNGSAHANGGTEPSSEVTATQDEAVAQTNNAPVQVQASRSKAK